MGSNQWTVIARYSISDYVHHHFFSLLATFLLIPFAASFFIAPIALGSYEKIMLDIILIIPHLFMLFFVLIAVIPFFHRQQQHQTPAFFIPALTHRAYFLYGISVASSVMLLLGLFVLFIAHLFLLWNLTGHWAVHCWPVYVMAFIEGLFFINAALFLTLRYSVPVATLLLFFLYGISYSNGNYNTFLCKQFPGTQKLFCLASSMLPDLNVIDVKSVCCYQLPLNGIHFMITIIYVLCWTIIFIVGACRQVNKKHF